MNITRMVQEIGNGGHVYLPKGMIGHKVIVSLAEKSIEEIEEEALSILKPYLEHIQGIYLYGSYARGEQTPGSDIDVLVITDGKIKLKRKVNEYEIVSLSLKQIESTISYAAVLIVPILKEAKPILNQGLIEKYKYEKLTKKNTRWYIETTESSLKLAEDWIREKDISSIPNLVYPLIMRLRGLHLIESLIHNKRYYNKEVTDYMIKKGISLEKAKQLNKIYREHRDNKAISSNSLGYNDITNLYNLVYEYFQKVNQLWEKLK